MRKDALQRAGQTSALFKASSQAVIVLSALILHQEYSVEVERFTMMLLICQYKLLVLEHYC